MLRFLHTAPALVLLVGLAACAADRSAHAPDSAPPTAGPSADSSRWRVMRATDSLGATAGVFMALDAEGSTPDGEAPPALFVRCEDGQTSVYVHWRTDLGADTVDVAYALDGGPWEADRWLTADQAAGLWTDTLAVPFLLRLAAHDGLRARAETASGPHELAFDVSGLDEAMRPLREACAW